MAESGHGLHHVEHVMGTVFSFDIRDTRTPAIETALGEAVGWLHHVDEVYSTYRPDSAVSRISRGELSPAQCSAEVRGVLDLCMSAARNSSGWFSHFAGGSLDPSGLVKGWSIEHASQLLHEAGAHHTCVNGGGDLQLRGEAARGLPGASASPTHCVTVNSARSSPVVTWPSRLPVPRNAARTSSTRTKAEQRTGRHPSR